MYTAVFTHEAFNISSETIVSKSSAHEPSSGRVVPCQCFADPSGTHSPSPPVHISSESNSDFTASTVVPHTTPNCYTYGVLATLPSTVLFNTPVVCSCVYISHYPTVSTSPSTFGCTILPVSQQLSYYGILSRAATFHNSYAIVSVLTANRTTITHVDSPSRCIFESTYQPSRCTTHSTPLASPSEPRLDSDTS